MSQVFLLYSISMSTYLIVSRWSWQDPQLEVGKPLREFSIRTMSYGPNTFVSTFAMPLMHNWWCYSNNTFDRHATSICTVRNGKRSWVFQQFNMKFVFRESLQTKCQRNTMTSTSHNFLNKLRTSDHKHKNSWNINLRGLSHKDSELLQI